jgi:hypothetical protein
MRNQVHTRLHVPSGEEDYAREIFQSLYTRADVQRDLFVCLAEVATVWASI